MKSMQNILSKTSTFVLAGGRGSRLAPLTDHRSKPAAPFGDRCIIDFTLSNCLKSNLHTPHVITQYQANHLTQHVRRWWTAQAGRAAASVDQGTLPGLPSFHSPVCVPAPENAYSGTADALFQNSRMLTHQSEHVLVLSADHIYEMNYRELLQFHVDSRADATLAGIVYPARFSREFGIVETDGGNRILGFEEKPARPKEIPGSPGKVLANMGIYVFRKEVFLEILRVDAANAMSCHDIGRNILPELVAHKNVYAFRFDGYWKDVGTLDAYYEANMEWLNALPSDHRMAGSTSVIAEGVRIHPTAKVVESILLPGVVIGPNARVRRAILDQNVHVTAGARIGYEDSASSISVIPANRVVTAKSKTRVQNRTSPEPMYIGGY